MASPPLELVGCPTCGAPAELEAWATAWSTRGPVEHVRLTCVRKHWYLMPRDMLTTPTPVPPELAAP